jgi:hypothetical protein
LVVWFTQEMAEEVGVALWVFALVVHLILAGWMAMQACHTMVHARESGMLGMLISTPLTVSRIVRGYYLGVWKGFTKPFMVLAVVELFVLTSQWVVLGSKEESALNLVLLFFFCGGTLAVTLLDVVAVTWFGLWMGLTTKKAGPALAKTVLYVLVLPLGMACLFIFWPLLALVKNLVFIHLGKEQLRRHLRPLVTEGRLAGQRALARQIIEPRPPVGPPDKQLPSVLRE